MKRIRLCLLLFLAVLLPVRGAVAAAMLCAVQPASHHEQRVHGEGHEHHHAETAASASDKCNLCAASCCLTPLPSQPPVVAPPLQGPSAAFPELRAPPVSFLSDGQERPPRSI